MKERDYLLYIDDNEMNTIIRICSTHEQAQALIEAHKKFHNHGDNHSYTIGESPWYFDSFVGAFFCEGCNSPLCPVVIAKD